MLDRKIVFYRATAPSENKPFAPHIVCGRLNERIKANQEYAVLESPDTTTAVRVIHQGTISEPSRLQVLALRTPENHPLEWGPGDSIRQLFVNEGRYPADLTHVVLWPDGYVAQDWHANAPRLGRLSYYLREKQGATVLFDTLYRGDMIDRLNELRGHLRSVEISLTSPGLAYRDRPGVLGTLIPEVYGHKAPSIAVQFGMGRYGPRDRFIDQETEDTVFAIAENAQEQVDRMVITGRNPRTSRSETINLLSERLGVDVSVRPSPDALALPHTDEMFDAILDAFASIRNDGSLESAIQAQAMRRI